jgi:hypothetical protein
VAARSQREGQGPTPIANKSGTTSFPDAQLIQTRCGMCPLGKAAVLGGKTDPATAAANGNED